MENFKILIIEDDLLVSNTLKKALKKSGYEVFTAFDGIEAVKMAQQEKPNLILLDVMLPKMDGFSVIEKIKNSQDIAHTPIIVMSAFSPTIIKEKIPEYEKKSKGSRTLFFIKKPFETEDLLKEIKDFLINKKHLHGKIINIDELEI
ncbi:MAG: response regulator [Elusimicrobia bacterium]|nr:response regulator [Elusimicrobiota bacterium]